MADLHDWHLMDAERGLEVRQTTPEGNENRWEVRTSAGEIVILDDEAFDQLRREGPNPGGLD